MGKIAILGAGNVGQAIAGHMTLLGHDVRLYSRWERDFEAINSTGGIELSGDVEGRAAKPLLTTDIERAVKGADTVIVAAPAFAHAYLSQQLAALLVLHFAEPLQVHSLHAAVRLEHQLELVQLSDSQHLF